MKKYLLISYINRSGSTFLINQLSKSDDLCVCPEADCLYDLLLLCPYNKNPLRESEINRLFSDIKFRSWNVDQSTVSSILRSKQSNLNKFLLLLEHFSDINSLHSQIIVFKHPLLFKVLSKHPEISSFRHVYWLFLIRDIRAIYLSQLRTISPHTKKPMCNNWFSLAVQFRCFAKFLLQEKHSNSIIIRYEEMIQNTSHVILDIFNLLNKPFETKWITHRKGRVSEFLTAGYKEIHSLIEKPADSSHIDNWKNVLTGKEKDEIMIFTGSLLEKLSYPVNPEESFLKLRLVSVSALKIIQHLYARSVNFGRILYYRYLPKAGVIRNIVIAFSALLLRFRFAFSLNRTTFSNPEIFCLFIGYPRSGHTLVAAMLDAHPQIMLSFEADVFKLIGLHYSRKMIFHVIKKNNRRFVKKHKCVWTGYNYEIKGQNQGSRRNIKIIGDKKAGSTTSSLHNNPELLHSLKHRIHLPVRMIHVVRNPFDTIASMVFHSLEKGMLPSESLFMKHIHYYFTNAACNQLLIQQYDQEILTVHYEDLVLHSKNVMLSLLKFLKLEYTEDYLGSCSEIVSELPIARRNTLQWPASIIDLILSKIKEIPFLTRYSSTSGLPSS